MLIYKKQVGSTEFANSLFALDFSAKKKVQNHGRICTIE